MSLQDNLFSDDVEYDVTAFSKDNKRRRVLVFPPVNNYRRFIIHQLVQDRFDDLHTFSIGQGAARRTVVCYKTDVKRDPKLNGVECKPAPTTRATDTLREMGVEGQRSSAASPETVRVQRAVKSAPKVQLYRPPAARKSRSEDARINAEQNPEPNPEQNPVPPITDTSSSAKSNRQRRPDRAVYVPRARRSLDSEGSPHPAETTRTHRANRCSGSSTSTSAGSAKSNSNFDLKESDVPIILRGNGECTKRESIPRDSSGDSSCSEKCSNGTSEEEHQLCTAPRSEFKEIALEALEPVKTDASDREGEPVDESSEVECERIDQLQLEATRERRVSNTPSEDDAIADSIKAYVNSESNIINTEAGRPARSKGNTMSPSQKNRKAEREISSRDEIANQKNTQMIRRNVVSDVLIISDSARKEPKTLKESSPTVALTPPEKKVKKVERPKSKPALPPCPPVKINRDECDWDSLFDDNGDCLDPSLIDELTSAVGDVVIEQPKSDYKAYIKHVEVSSDEFGHVIEIYNFPSEFKTSDLATVFSPYKNAGFELKWVDDTHCLGVFSSPLIAAEVLASDHPLVKTRPLSEATALSKTKAKRSAEFLQPYRSRPETCAALARRLVTGALGVRLATARQEREHEKNVLREAKEKRRLANKQREDAWEGIIPEK